MIEFSWDPIDFSVLTEQTESSFMLMTCVSEPKSSRHVWESFFTNQSWALILGVLASSSGVANTARRGKFCCPAHGT